MPTDSWSCTSVTSPTSTALARIDLTRDSLEKVLAALVRPSPVPVVDQQLPSHSLMAKEHAEALARVNEVYGVVNPTERRRLTAAEASDLIKEMQVLKAVKKMAEDRLADLRTIASNHLDCVAEEVGVADEDTPREAKTGHYILDGEIAAQGADKAIRRETSAPTTTVDIDRLRALAADPDFPDFTHRDYLAWTTETRVVDANKIMLALRGRPELVEALARASSAEHKTPRVQLR